MIGGGPVSVSASNAAADVVCRFAAAIETADRNAAAKLLHENCALRRGGDAAVGAEAVLETMLGLSGIRDRAVYAGSDRWHTMRFWSGGDFSEWWVRVTDGLIVEVVGQA